MAPVQGGDIALVFLLLHAGVRVTGDGGCPAPVEVERRLAALGVGPAGEGEAPHQARLSTVAGRARVELLREDGTPIAARDLPADGSCEDLAGALAVVVATWEAELDPRTGAGVELPPPAPDDAAARPPPVEPAPPVDLPPPPAIPPPPAPAPVLARPAPAVAAPHAPLRFALALGLAASLAGADLAPGARLDGSFARGNDVLGLGLSLAGTASHTASVGALSGVARWSRLALGLGPELRLGGHAAVFDAHAQALVGVLSVQGVGLPTTSSDASAQLGAGAGGRVVFPWGNAASFVGLDFLVWPGRDALVIEGVADQGRLPRLEVQLSAGLSLGRFP
jgi:hypothetical protein